MSMVVIVNGPNLNLLGTREPDIYGRVSWDEVKEKLNQVAADNGHELEFFQSNHEGAIVDFLQDIASRADGLIINPGAFTHYSYALHDALAALEIPVIELHVSNIYAREEWRARSVISPVVKGVISGFGVGGYELALQAMMNSITAS